MLSDEEKKAIEWLKLVSNVATNKYTMKEQLYLKIVLNLIKKQSKEIEELKDTSNKYYYEWKHLEADVINNYISKEESEQKEKQAYIDGTNIADKLCNKKWQDKIKAKIEYYEKIDNPVGKRVLQSLLEKE